MINEIKVRVITGANDPNDDARIFFGLSGGEGREFRMRTGNEANPFRENSTTEVIFGGAAANVKEPNKNNPQNPPIDEGNVDSAYIRIEPRQEEPWDIKDAQVFINGVLIYGLKLKHIVLEEDAGELVHLF
jgi:hypothetical protein